MITRMIQTTGRRKKRVRSILLSGAKRPDPPDRRPGHLNSPPHRRLPGLFPPWRRRITPGPSGARDTTPSVTRPYTVGTGREPVRPRGELHVTPRNPARFSNKSVHNHHY